LIFRELLRPVQPRGARVLSPEENCLS